MKTSKFDDGVDNDQIQAGSWNKSEKKQISKSINLAKEVNDIENAR